MPASPVRLHIVSGKGGTGKTTVAAALALALADGGGNGTGHNVLLVEVEGRQGIAALFGVPPLPYEERLLPAGRRTSGVVRALAIDAEQALLDYLETFYKLGRAGRALRKVGAIDFVTSVAPGLRDVLLTGKAYEAARRRDRSGRYVYDAVVMDAPPTGRIAQFLRVHAELAGLARMGPIGGQADGIAAMLRSPAAAVHLVTVLEEMPVQETLDALEELRSAGLSLGAVMINAVRRPLLPPANLAAAAVGELDRHAIAGALVGAGVGSAPDTASALVEEAAEHAERVGLEDVQRRRLDGVDRRSCELPMLPGGIDRDSLDRLAGLLVEQGVAQ